MRRRWIIWGVLSAGLGVAAGALGVVTGVALRLERAEAAAREQAAVEERVRLALWRMDSELAALLAQESAYPDFMYAATYRPPYAMQPRYMPVASPLLTLESPYIRLHFQMLEGAAPTSPQVPSEAELRQSALVGATVDQLDRLIAPERVAEYGARLAELAGWLTREEALAHLPAEDVAAVAVNDGEPGEPVAPPRQRALSPYQVQREVQEEEARERQQQRAIQQQVLNTGNLLAPLLGNGPMTPLRPVWIGGELLLLRRVVGSGVQGCLLDWPAVRVWLEGLVADLLPEAELVAAAGAEAGRRLVALPVELRPGVVPGVAGRPSPVPLALAVAWGGLGLAGVALTLLVLGVVQLSERRGAFVSAVTHELRTPLTTFRLYTDLLADERLTDAGRRRRCLETLRLEAERLSHLVENVLAFARLERGRRETGEVVTVAALRERALERLMGRADRSGLTLEWAETEDGLRVRANAGHVEQILLNLVDNACKYGGGVVRITAGRAGRHVAVRVEDDGPGVAAAEVGQLFRPFHKSAHRAAETAPGVGLGLSLSRRLARDMGGDLRLVSGGGRGACFELRLAAG